MSALPGGAADKLGNRYEGWWTLCRLADVLRGNASTMRLEPPGIEGIGAEFYVDELHARWYEQVKNAPSQGNWTLRRLIREEVIQSFAVHLKRGHYVRFVASTSALDLADLAQHARDTQSPEEYETVLNDKLSPMLKDLETTWNVPRASVWEYLRRVYVQHHSPEQLRHLLHQKIEVLIQGDPTMVVGLLRDWLDDMLHQIITAPLVWTFLQDQGLRRKLLAGDPGSLEALAGTVNRHSQRVRSNRPALAADNHPQLADLLDLLTGDATQQVILIHGRAGAGKSTLAADALRELGRRGWYAAAVSMDLTQPAMQSAAGLGRTFDLPSSPIVLLDGVANGSPAILLIDQLDAVSTYSGRMQDSYTAVAEVLEQARTLPNVKIMSVIRTPDLEADPRLRVLRSDAQRVAAFEVRDLPAGEVDRALLELNIDSTTMAPATLRLLSIPLHLTIFANISPSSRTVPYKTLQDLYQQFTWDLRRRIEVQIGHLDWSAITAALVTFMSDHEQLRAPSVTLENAAVGEIDALISHGILVKDEDSFLFFHETYFDFLFARAFITSGNDLHQFLATSGQYLFRRAQTRQVLEYLAAKDRPTFHKVVATLLESPSIRPHLHQIVYSLLNQLDATADDWRAIKPLVFSEHRYASRLRNLMSAPAWFDAIDNAGDWEVMLSNESSADLSADQLVNAARVRPARVAILARSYVGNSDRWTARLRALIVWSLSPELVDLAVQLIERGDLDDARGPIAVNADFWTIIYGIKDVASSGAARIVGAYLRRSVTRAEESAGKADPFASGVMNRFSTAGGSSTIIAIANKDSLQFFQEVVPFIAEVANTTTLQSEPGELRRSLYWGYPLTGDPIGVDDALYIGLQDALARLEPAYVRDLIAPLRNSDFHDMRFLVCRALTILDDGNESIDWLTSDERNLQLGWRDSPHWASRDLIIAATRICDAEHLNALSERLLAYYSPWEKTAGGRREYGWAQYTLLSGISERNRSATVRSRIEEWRRKFGNELPAEPQPMKFGVVPPPIPDDAAPLMTDDDWIRAVRKYRSDSPVPRGNHLVGGAFQLAQLLGARAMAEPNRFAALALTFDRDTPPIYINSVIPAVAPNVSVSLLEELCDHARKIAGQAAGLAICRAVRAAHTTATEKLIDLVLECAADKDPEIDTDTEHNQMSSLPDTDYLVTVGLNCTRGAAAIAIAEILSAQPHLAQRMIPIITRLSKDRIPAVLAMAAQPIQALLDIDVDTSLSLAGDLFEDAADIFSAGPVSTLLFRSILERPDTFGRHLLSVLDGPPPAARRAGQVWANLMRFGALPDEAPRGIEELSSWSRRGAAEVLANDPGSAPEMLQALFGDSDPEVSAAAAQSVRITLDQLDDDSKQEMVRSFVDSNSFVDHCENLFYALNDDLVDIDYEVALLACQKAISAGGPALGDIRTRWAAVSGQIVTTVFRAYRQANVEGRTKALDLIDALVNVGALGLDEALQSER